jgi:serine/threonine-protein kinase
VSGELYDRAKSIFQRVVEAPPERRAALLDAECGGDEALRREAESLLEAHDKSGDFLEGPAVKLCPECNTTFAQTVRFCPHDGAVLVENLEALVGETLDGLYVIEALLGKGGMGAVYRARHILLGDRVAVKILSRQLSSNESFLKRFQREGRAARKFRHPNAVTVHDLRATGDGMIYMVQEYVEGRDLRAELRARGPLAPAEALDMLEQIASVLDAAHRGGVVHRDLKPENVMVARDADGKPLVKVLDLGIAKLRDVAHEQPSTSITVPGQIMGTPQYMSPEQWGEIPRDGGVEIDGRADVYSLGVMAFEMLTGAWPFKGSSLVEYRRAHVQHPIPDAHAAAPAIPAAAGRALAHALAKDRGDRYATAGNFVAELRRALEPAGAGATAATAIQKARETSPAAGEATGLAGGAVGTAGAPSSSGTFVRASEPAPPPDAGAAPTLPTVSERRAGRSVLGRIAVASVLLAAVVGAAFWLSRDTAAPEPGPQPTASQPSPREAMRYYLEVRQKDGSARRATGLEPLAVGDMIRFHFLPSERGYLYLVGPGPGNVPHLFYTSGERGPLEKGREVAFPEGEALVGVTRDTYENRMTVIFSPVPVDVPALSGAPHALTPADQRELDAFRREHPGGSGSVARDADGQLLVTIPGSGDKAPVVFDIAITQEPAPARR